jgi:hypothetical protein
MRRKTTNKQASVAPAVTIPKLVVPESVPFIKIGDVDEALLSSGERAFLTFWRIHCQHISPPVMQWKFEPSRNYRADFAWPWSFTVLEIEGGVWMRDTVDERTGETKRGGGRHTRAAGFTLDCLKYNLMCARGLRVLRMTPQMLTAFPLECLDHIQETIALDIRIVRMAG